MDFLVEFAADFVEGILELFLEPSVDKIHKRYQRWKSKKNGANQRW